ncbi:MAG: hypothetical protein ACK4NT_05425, partial [Candidatus Omnitrophota bacterium]
SEGKYELIITLPPQIKPDEPIPISSSPPYTIYLTASAEDEGYIRSGTQTVSLNPGDKKEVNFALTKYHFPPPIGNPNPRP